MICRRAYLFHRFKFAGSLVIWSLSHWVIGSFGYWLILRRFGVITNYLHALKIKELLSRSLRLYGGRLYSSAIFKNSSRLIAPGIRRTSRRRRAGWCKRPGFWIWWRRRSWGDWILYLMDLNRKFTVYVARDQKCGRGSKFWTPTEFVFHHTN
jgi:hypothetical protein